MAVADDKLEAAQATAVEASQQDGSASLALTFRPKTLALALGVDADGDYQGDTHDPARLAHLT